MKKSILYLGILSIPTAIAVLSSLPVFAQNQQETGFFINLKGNFDENTGTVSNVSVSGSIIPNTGSDFTIQGNSSYNFQTNSTTFGVGVSAPLLLGDNIGVNVTAPASFELTPSDFTITATDTPPSLFPESLRLDPPFLPISIPTPTPLPTSSPPLNFSSSSNQFIFQKTNPTPTPKPNTSPIESGFVISLSGFFDTSTSTPILQVNHVGGQLLNDANKFTIQAGTTYNTNSSITNFELVFASPFAIDPNLGLILSAPSSSSLMSDDFTLAVTDEIPSLFPEEFTIELQTLPLKLPPPATQVPEPSSIFATCLFSTIWGLKLMRKCR